MGAGWHAIGELDGMPGKTPRLVKRESQKTHRARPVGRSIATPTERLLPGGTLKVVQGGDLAVRQHLEDRLT